MCPRLSLLCNHPHWSRCRHISPHEIGIRIGQGPPSSDAISEAGTEALLAAKAPLTSSRTMRRRLTSSNRGRWSIPLLLIPSPLTPLPLTPLPLTLPLLTPPQLTLPLLRRRGSHWEVAEMLVGKWYDSCVNSDVGSWRQIFVSLVYSFRRDIKVNLIIILLQPIAVQSPFLDRQYIQVNSPLRQFLLISLTVPWNV